ncbi:hypothetical protein QQZ08_006140 [Neonectria magnoliae]|uniref:Rhodopsin domain-containing protein n=1 Tax=Neonectria magnoliae TaxID=2732573 RepID=A0ABR1I200_9HYPO
MDDDELQESKQIQLSLVAWIFTGMAMLTVLTKLYTTLVVFQRPGWDDLMIFLSLLCSIIVPSLVQVSVDLGLGLHTAAIQTEQGGFKKMVKTRRIQILGLPNVAILILIERLAGRTDTISRRTLRGIVSIQLIFAAVSVIIIFVQCKPTRYLWDQSIKGTCWSPDVFNYSSYIVSAFTAFTDLVLAIVPIHAFWKLQLKLREKLEVSFMLGLTLLSAIFTIVKATYMHLFTDRVDPRKVFNVVDSVIWGLVEQNIVIMAASVPTLRPLLRHIKRKGAIRTTTSYFHSDTGHKRAESASEVPLDDMSRQVAQGSRRSFEVHNSSDDWNHGSETQTTPQYE